MTSALRPSTTTSAGGDHGAGDGKSKDNPVAAKAMGFLVVFGIAASIAVALLAKPNSHPERSQGPPHGILQCSPVLSLDLFSSVLLVSLPLFSSLESGLRRHGNLYVNLMFEVSGVLGLRRCDQGSKWDHRKKNRIYAGKKLIIP
ncbi:hypothetical protein GW17_00055101 [Ensete ventricosum]|nr:hypothetical protein GW17_00055101 [Ensete ventricosum]